MNTAKEKPKLATIVWDYERQRYIAAECVTCADMSCKKCSGWLRCHKKERRK